MLLAKYFGTSLEFDQWLAILILPGFLATALASSFPGIIVPWLSPLSRQAWPARQQLFKLALSIAKKVVLVLVLAGFFSFIFNPHLFLVVGAIFITCLQVLIGYQRALVQSLKKISWVVGSPILSTVIICLVLYSKASVLGISSLPIGLVIGYIVEAGALYLVVRKNFKNENQVPIETSQIERNIWHLTVAGLAMGSTIFIDQLSVQWLFGGGIAELTYGTKITNALVGLLGGALSVLFFPKLAGAVGNRDFKKIIYKSGILMFCIGGAVVATLALASHDLIQLLFERGQFKTADTQIVHLINLYSLGQIPFYLFGTVGVYALQIFKRNKTILKISLINTFVNVVLNFIFGRMFGIPGIALSTTVVYIGSLIMIFFSLRKSWEN